MRHKLGCTFPSEDSTALAEAILALSEKSKEHRDTMGSNALRYYQANFNRDMLIARLEEWMTELSSENYKENSLS